MVQRLWQSHVSRDATTDACDDFARSRCSGVLEDIACVEVSRWLIKPVMPEAAGGSKRVRRSSTVVIACGRNGTAQLKRSISRLAADLTTTNAEHEVGKPSVQCKNNPCSVRLKGTACNLPPSEYAWLLIQSVEHLSAMQPPVLPEALTWLCSLFVWLP